MAKTISSAKKSAGKTSAAKAVTKKQPRTTAGKLTNNSATSVKKSVAASAKAANTSQTHAEAQTTLYRVKRKQPGCVVGDCC